MNRMPLATALVLVAIATSFVPSGNAAHGTTESKTYVSVATGTILVAGCGPAPGVGGVRLCPADAPAQVALTVEDAAAVLPVSAFVIFQDAGGNQILGSERFCGGATFALPPGTAEVEVWVGAVWHLLGLCLDAPNPGTVGTVTAVWG